MGYGPVMVAVAIVVYSWFSGWLSRTPLTGPIIFTTLGVILGPDLADMVGLRMDTELTQLLFEVTLVLVLFSDAAAVSNSDWRKDASLPGRLLAVGLPLTILLGAGVAALLFTELAFWEVVLVGVILAPTDAALGQAVISNPRVPQRIRSALNVESGLNDGICIPAFFVVLEAAELEEKEIAFSTFAGELAAEILIATLIGAVIGFVGSWALRLSVERKWIAEGWGAISLFLVALLTWSLADAAGGSGFIAAWVAGLVVGRRLGEELPGAYEFTEDSGHVLTLVSFFLFGVYGLGPVLEVLSWELAVYAVLSLTLVRMLPVALATVGSGLKAPSVLYLGWFGPRGLASIILVLIIMTREADLAGENTIYLVMATTVGLSIYAHGATSVWGASRYADWYEAHPEHPDVGEGMVESKPTPEPHVTRRVGVTPMDGDPDQAAPDETG